LNLLRPFTEQNIRPPENIRRVAHWNPEDGESSVRTKLNADAARFAGSGSQKCGVVSVTYKIELLRSAGCGFPVRNRDELIIEGKGELRAASRRGNGAVSCREASRAFKNPNRLDIGLQLRSWFDERKFHFALAFSLIPLG